MPLFCDIALAERIERAEARLMAESSEAAHRRRGDGRGFVLPIAGGVASFAEPDSPFNKVAGLGFGGLTSATLLDEVEAAFAEHKSPVQVELSQLADPAIGELLTRRGYRLVSFENVLGLALGAPRERITPPGVEVRRTDEVDPWLRVVGDSFAAADVEGVASHEEFPRETVENAMRDFAAVGVLRYLALREGEVAGGASFRVTDGIAQLTGAATLPAHRRNGVQTALLSARLADASGCDLAIVTTQPGSKSQQNVQRQGFDLLYTRAILVKGD
ncbi:GNAT family N-acetyltransferase [Amycolatopsis sp. cg5]|uniref:GNAT family N-acetyltransferase n=1 Tax=Amycolatopsis sp. cg5 TaxID=3238802 RepID=UPI0035231189